MRLKKEFGQFFSGLRLGKLLTWMLPIGSDFQNWKIIDPMVGTGDLLKACLSRNANPKNLWGIEIDKEVFNLAKKDLPDCNLINQNAFDFIGRAKISAKYDLVITNPPYIRYQKQKGAFSFEETKQKILGIVPLLTDWSAEERKKFRSAIECTPAVSDYSILALFLCLTLVKKGGYLSLILPETWITRSYSENFKAFISNFYELQTIVKDEGSRWFPDAQVKTDLVLLHRPTMPKQDNNVFVISLQAKSIEEKSLNKNLNVQDLKGYFAFNYLCRNEIKTSSSQSYAQKKILQSIFLQEGKTKENKSHSQHLVKQKGIDTIEEVHLGQGFRSGANQFFYLTPIVRRATANGLLTAQTKKWDCQIVSGRPTELIPTIHKTKRESLILCAEDADEFLLYLVPGETASPLLASYVKRGNLFQMERDGKKIHFWELTAVKTNINSNATPKREWFNLPKLQKRHLPNLAIPRVNGDAVRCYFLDQTAPIVVDANFLTLWSNDLDKIYLFFALLNSNWFKYFCEENGTVMGGGALKLDKSIFSGWKGSLLQGSTKNELISFAKSHIGGDIDINSFIQLTNEAIRNDPILSKYRGKDFGALIKQKIEMRKAKK